MPQLDAVMLRVLDPDCPGDPREPLSRRESLRVGGLGFAGLSLPALLAARESAAPKGLPAAALRRSFGRAKSVIIFGLVGGPPQHETFDPKPDAPKEIRGDFGTIPSATDGLRVGELMPRTAKLTDKMAVLRAVTSGDNAHSTSGYQMLTGIPHAPLNRENALPGKPNDWPSIGALVRAVRRDAGRLPAAITVPDHIWNDGNKPWPGQDAGFLGRRYDPWVLHCDPSSKDFKAPAGLVLPEGVTSTRATKRKELLARLNGSLGYLVESDAVSQYSIHARKALELLTAKDTRAAFDLGLETEATRTRYGPGRFQQSTLLARRLVEAGVSLVQINWTRIKGFPNQGGWDTHKVHSKGIKECLMPRMDQTFSALIEDLDERGLLDETLVVWIGEFGRTPKFNKNGGRDHWGQCFSVALAGGGIRGGTVHGTSDKHAAYPVDGVVKHNDLIATVFHCLGVMSETEVHDPLGRPIPVTRGKVIGEIV